MRIILTLLSILFYCNSYAESTANEILNNIAVKYEDSKGIKANIEISSPQGVLIGHIIMQGNSFKLSTAELCNWYDGKTQWTYSQMTGEVNIITPTIDDLQFSNPYTALVSSQKRRVPAVS